MTRLKLTLLLLTTLWHGPSVAADDWLTNLQKGDWQKAIEGVTREAAPSRTQRSTGAPPAATPRATPQRAPATTAARTRARAAREARAAQRAAARESRRAVNSRRATPPSDADRAERRRSRSR
ncbi:MULTISPECIES: hypothetical protein [Denitromonas]|uniref:Uncharacterized protein n=2 Tax=Denitromonas TaxID=139331 RepID=A0A557QXL9_9RHOO|nr:MULTISPECIES: hypothetical protein [Denitromonas]TVO57651.1 hypothetical protein FHP91_08245 [Denitromonas halophila]TVO68074.1 hypothetical protein FHP90_05715 [Denitromonas ohlonensis]TVO78021.1 hypothetical protein FHP89_05945 [Denitromonas ohlonensis]